MQYMLQEVAGRLLIDSVLRTHDVFERQDGRTTRVTREATVLATCEADSWRDAKAKLTNDRL